MTVRERFIAKLGNFPASSLEEMLADAALSPIDAEPPLRAVSLGDVYEDYLDDEEWKRGFKYALSTLYYSMSAMFSGGSQSEQVGDVHASTTGHQITKDDRNYYRSLGDKLRKELGYEPEEDVREAGGAFDATYRHKHYPKSSTIWRR